MRKLLALLTSLAVLVMAAAPVVAVAPPAPADAGSVYVVVMDGPSVYEYRGGVAGIPATKPKQGEKVDRTSATVLRYVAHLQATHDAAIERAGGGKKLYDYAFAANGFAAVLTSASAARLQQQAGVLAVLRDQMRTVQTDNSPHFLGLDDAGGLWQELGGQSLAGEDVVIGVIDTGIWPEHPSFSDRVNGKLVYRPLNDFHGRCVPGEAFNASMCNQKLVSAQYFNAGFLQSAGALPEHEYNSVRDAEGHGTHTASTSGGNAGVNAEIFGRDFGVISGIAPRARIAAYKALWGGSGTTSDLSAAIDAAVADGVDVINYSIGSDTPSLTGADELAFLFANDAGVFASVSNGNAGPGAQTAGSPASAPWLTAVGASTQDRTFEATATLGDGSEFVGASVTTGTGGQLSLVDSADVALAGADPDEAELCFRETLDPAKVSGKIVLCLRGISARVDKSLAVSEAGGAGMILYNPDDAQALVTDLHWVPSVHINFTAGTAIKAYIDAAGAAATAAISDSHDAPAQGSVMADFSSRGPNGAAFDIIKPDVTAPGVNILAGHTPTPPLEEGGAPDQLFQSISGTSMSAPHVAGVAALLVQLHPDWTPDMIKSALMTTGRQDVTKEDGTTPADPFDFGGGHIVPNSAGDPGLVYTSSFNGYLAFMCDAAPQVFANPAATCAALDGAGFSLDASDLNLASIGVADLVAEQTVTRTVTSVTPGASTWTASVTGVPGFSATTPASFSLQEGESETFQITFTTTSAAPGVWSFGALTLTDGEHTVRSPIALRATAVDAPPEAVVEGAAESGETTFDVSVGYAGTLTADGFGLAADNDEVVHLNPDPDQDISTGTFTDGVVFNDFTLTGAQYYAGGLDEDANVVGDLDVFLFHDADSDGFTLGDLVAQAADGDSHEIVELIAPDDGAYRLVLHGWGAPPGGVDVTRHQWTVAQIGADTGSLVATAGSGDPFAVSPGDTVSVTAAWSGLTDPGEYRGVVGFSDGTTTWDTTVVRVIR